MEDTKQCSQCKIFKPKSDFGKRASSKDGLRSECKQCRKESRLENIDEVKRVDKEYRSKNTEKRRKSSRKYYWNNKDKKKQYDQEYYVLNKDKIIDRHNEHDKIKRKEDPGFRLRGSVSSAINKILKNNNSSKNGESCLKYLNYTIEGLKQYIENQFEFWMNWDNYGIYNKETWDDDNSDTWTWQLDHIIPQSDLPYTSMEDENFKKCWALENLRPLSSKINNLDGVNKTRHKKAA